MKWIRTSLKLPEFHTDVLFCTGDKTEPVRVGAFHCHNHQFISNGVKYYKSDVKHWMPLPEPPEDNDNEN